MSYIKVSYFEDWVKLASPSPFYRTRDALKSKPEFLVFIFCFVSVSKPDIDKLYEAIKVYHESKGHSDGKGTDLIFDPQVPKLLLQQVWLNPVK